MKVYVENDNRFLGNSSGRLLTHSNYNIAYYKVLNTNRHIAIISLNSMNIHGISTVVISDYKDEPLWKQDMHMRMGQKPRKIETRKVIQVQEISVDEAIKYQFKVYKIKY